MEVNYVYPRRRNVTRLAEELLIAHVRRRGFKDNTMDIQGDVDTAIMYARKMDAELNQLEKEQAHDKSKSTG